MVIELKSEQLRVQFNSFGGALSSIKDAEGLEYLWQGDATYWSGQAPVLFPICGSLREDTALYIDEKEQESKGNIPRHGLVRKKEFELVEQTDKSVTFAIEDDENSYQNYPYHFRLEITYTLLARQYGLNTRFSIKKLARSCLTLLVDIQDLIVLYWTMRSMKITI